MFKQGRKKTGGRKKGTPNKKQNVIIKDLDSFEGKNVIYVFELIMRESSRKIFKIGRTTSLKSRLKNLSSRLPFDFKLSHSIVVEKKELAFAEKTLHRYFSKSRIRLEWFNLSENDLKIIYSLSNINDIKQLKTP